MLAPPRFSHYSFLRHLQSSNGGYSEVIVAYDEKSKKEVACKVFDRNNPHFALIEQEIRVGQCLRHPNIAPVLDVVYEEKVIILVMEYYKNGDMFNLIMEKNKNILRIMRAFRQVVEAVVYLHDRGIAHMDIKPDNVFIDDNYDAKLSDFGCCETPASRKIQFYSRGTVCFAAPEIFNGGVEDHRPSDIWSLGIFILTALTRQLPYCGEVYDDDEVIRQVKKGDLKINGNLPCMASNIVKKCCQFEPKDRVNARQLLTLICLPLHSRNTNERRMSDYRFKIRSKPILFSHSNKSNIHVSPLCY